MRCSELYKSATDVLNAFNQIERYFHSGNYYSKKCVFYIDDEGYWTIKGRYIIALYPLGPEKEENKLTFKIDKVIGDVDCEHYPKSVIERIPDYITGSLFLRDSRITSLKGLKEKYIGGDIHLNRSEITTLEDLPNRINKSLWCSDTSLRTLKGCPDYVGASMVISNNEISTLDWLPSYIGGNLDIANNPIKNDKPISDELLKKEITIKGNLVLGKNLNWLKDMIPDCWHIEGKMI